MTKLPADEQISAWLDDELPPREAEMVAARLARSAPDQERLARYSLIGECLRGSAHGLAATGLHRSVSRKLAASPVEAAPDGRTRQPARWLDWVPAALAAGIIVAVAGLAQWSLGRHVDPAGNPAARIAGSMPASGRTLPVVRRDSLPPERLTTYLVYHGGYSGALSRQVLDTHIVSQGPYGIRLRNIERRADD